MQKFTKEGNWPGMEKKKYNAMWRRLSDKEKQELSLNR